MSKAPAWDAVYAMTLSTFVLVASEFMPVRLLSPIAADLHLTAGQAGQAITISGLLATIASLSLGRLTNAVDRRVVLLGLTALLMVSDAPVTYAPSYAMLMLGRAVLGIAIGGFWSMSAAITMRLVPAEAVPKALARLNRDLSDESMELFGRIGEERLARTAEGGPYHSQAYAVAATMRPCETPPKNDRITAPGAIG